MKMVIPVFPFPPGRYDLRFGSFHKIFREKMENACRKAPKASRNQTFLAKIEKFLLRKAVSVTRKGGHYALHKGAVDTPKIEGKNAYFREIVVKSQNFSTLSTSLSTASACKITGIFIQNGLHKKIRHEPTKSPLFRHW
jgi:hypothetical protein